MPLWMSEREPQDEKLRELVAVMRRLGSCNVEQALAWCKNPAHANWWPVVGFIAQDQPIPAIKCLREQTGLGLRESKYEVERVIDEGHRLITSMRVMGDWNWAIRNIMDHLCVEALAALVLDRGMGDDSGSPYHRLRSDVVQRAVIAAKNWQAARPGER